MSMITHAPLLVWLPAGALLVLLALLLTRAALGAWLRPRPVQLQFVPAAEPAAGPRSLVVLAHGMAGRRSVDGLARLVQQTLPRADLAVLDYDSRPFANTDPYNAANVLELQVHALVQQHGHAEVVLVGHSAGVALLRKAFVWAQGLEQDRRSFGLRGPRHWAGRVSRIVMLAGINRGWSVDPRPAHMPVAKAAAIRVLLVLGRVLDFGRLARGLVRGAPFMADTRVQWLRLSRSRSVVQGLQPFPQLIQLLGDADDIVAKADGMDLVAARGTVFRTLAQTTHADITQVVQQADTRQHDERTRCIRHALLGDLQALEPDQPDPALPVEDRGVTRLVFVLHGIRDYGEWTEVVRGALDQRLRAQGERAVVVNLKYGWFPMLPFILYGDRQRNVRTFMDEYTECLARYPEAAAAVDAVGHSNGTYILASALVRYHTPVLRRVFFAGSVVPKHYPWQRLADEGRVGQVVNVVATADWVVALFPKFFEQIADWLRRRPEQGWLDIGAAGFRGFLDAGEGSAPVTDIKFSPGAHGTGVQVDDRAKLDAIVGFVAGGAVQPLQQAFGRAATQHGLLSTLSNVSWLVWSALALLAVLLGGGAWAAAVALGAAGAWGLAAYGLVLLALLNSV